MFSKAFTGLVAAGVLLAAQTAVADDGHGWKRGHSKHRGANSGYDYAEVVDVDPIVRQVRVTTPRRECWTETRYDYETRYESVPVGGGYGRPHHWPHDPRRHHRWRDRPSDRQRRRQPCRDRGRRAHRLGHRA
jgi:hypothetical protein